MNRICVTFLLAIVFCTTYSAASSAISYHLSPPQVKEFNEFRIKLELDCSGCGTGSEVLTIGGRQGLTAADANEEPGDGFYYWKAFYRQSLLPEEELFMLVGREEDALLAGKYRRKSERLYYGGIAGVCIGLFTAFAASANESGTDDTQFTLGVITVAGGIAALISGKKRLNRNWADYFYVKNYVDSYNEEILRRIVKRDRDLSTGK